MYIILANVTVMQYHPVTAVVCCNVTDVVPVYQVPL